MFPDTLKTLSLRTDEGGIAKYFLRLLSEMDSRFFHSENSPRLGFFVYHSLISGKNVPVSERFSLVYTFQGMY